MRTLITGASSGLGAEMARQLAAAGHDLALTARRTDRLDDLTAEIGAVSPGVRVRSAPLDVSDLGAVPRVVQQLRAELGGLERVVVNAGAGKGRPIGSGRPDANIETLTTNVLGALATMEAAMAVFREQGHGHLVVVSSVMSVRAMPTHMTAYAASKAAVARLAEGVRAEVDAGELKGRVRVTVLHPGYIASEMTGAKSGRTPLMVDTETGVAAMVEAIEKEVGRAFVPRWPWEVLGRVLAIAPPALARRLG
ncbi:SDR family oxidoreductase [Nocardioides bruguierae]|uniref:SDR family oxidoreductase n=1 Tax=Nocardioides bruguierae TaxID=2945102 RepID=UPI0020210049|nr:SDR family oxidoreductase [Nocardioides bruguierae]MCL8024078.1 SDR family oxidoreductase [Nocardioides bruguierae]